MEPVTPNKKGGLPIDGADEPTNVIRPVGEDTGMVVSEYEIAPGTQLGEYRIEGPLGGGGMGEVFSAIHPKIGKRAAIKVLKQELSNPFNVERFIDEAKVVNTIGHPNIVDIFAFGEMPDGRCYFVMELLVGETLRERISRGPMTVDEVRAILKPLTRALDAAHAKGVIHRDLKPDNVFLVEVAGEKPIVKLLDFGIAKLAKADHRIEQTKSGVMVGTPQYIAPEQAKGHNVDQRADIYALGGITFEMLTGRPPFVADNAMEMVAKHLMEAPPRPSSIVPTISPELDSLIVAMLAKDPARRPTIADIALIIDRLKAGPLALDDASTLERALPGDDDARPPGVSPRPQTPVPIAAATPAPVAPVFTPSPLPTSTFGQEPISGAHTSVEPVVAGSLTASPILAPIADHTERDAVEIGRSRGFWIGLSVVVLGIAMILSFIVIKVVKGEAPQQVAQTSEAAVASPDAAATAEADADLAVATPDAATVEVADAAVDLDAATTPAADAAIVRDAGVTPPPPQPKRGRLVIDVVNAGKATSIYIGGSKVSNRTHHEHNLVVGQVVWVEVRSTDRMTKKVPVKVTVPNQTVNLRIPLDLGNAVMEPGK